MGFVGRTQVEGVRDLHDLLQTLPVGKPSYYLLQRPDRIEDWKSERPGIDELEAFSAGRLFGQSGEVRWKSIINGYTLLWLSEAELPKGFDSLGNWLAGELQEVYLQGAPDKYHANQWRDTRLPKILRYPIAEKKVPKIQVIPYRDLETQAVHFTRFCRFVEGEQ